ncbi:MAG: hypothetical protein Q8K46_02480, partial [Deltaproteobacteria bacterium]|nr:hypothetical protein [Deltaproteobacteria bacterium]
MADGKDIEEVYGLGDAALFDEFFSFLSHFGITDLALKLKPKIKKRETETNFLTFFISAILASALERFFNNVISVLAKHSFFPKHIHALMDASEIQSTERCVGCGKVSKEKAPELRRRGKRIRKVLETVFGFKIWVVWDSLSKL